MRWFAIALLLVASNASALKIREPALVRACRESPSWEALGTCITKHGFGMQVVKRLANARLLRVDEPGELGARAPLGFALYVEKHGLIRLGGLHETDIAGLEVLALETVPVRKFTGYRFDIGFNENTTATIDGETVVPAHRQARSSVFCSGEHWACVEATTMCDVRIDGMTYFMYRGTATVDDLARLHNRGAKTLIGPGIGGCQDLEEFSLGWPVTPELD